MPLRSTPPAPASAVQDPILTAVPQTGPASTSGLPYRLPLLTKSAYHRRSHSGIPVHRTSRDISGPRNVQTLKTQLSSIICSPLSLKSSTRLPEGPVVHHPLTTHFTEKETQFQHFSDLPLRGQDALRDKCPVQNTGLSWREEMEPV